MQYIHNTEYNILYSKVYTNNDAVKSIITAGVTALRGEQSRVTGLNMYQEPAGDCIVL